MKDEVNAVCLYFILPMSRPLAASGSDLTSLKRHAEHWDARAAQNLLGGRAEEEFFGRRRAPAHTHDDHRQVEVARDLQNLYEGDADDDHALDVNLVRPDSFERALEARLGLLPHLRRDVLGRAHPRGHCVLYEVSVNHVQHRQVAARRGDAERHTHGVNRSRREVNGNEYVCRFEHCYLLLRGRGEEEMGRRGERTTALMSLASLVSLTALQVSPSPRPLVSPSSLPA